MRCHSDELACCFGPWQWARQSRTSSRQGSRRFTYLAKSEGFSDFFGKEREATKHVGSFGVDFWIRVQFSAPPPSLNSAKEPYENCHPKTPCDLWSDCRPCSLRDCAKQNPIGARS